MSGGWRGRVTRGSSIVTRYTAWRRMRGRPTPCQGLIPTLLSCRSSSGGDPIRSPTSVLGALQRGPGHGRQKKRVPTTRVEDASRRKSSAR